MANITSRQRHLTDVPVTGDKLGNVLQKTMICILRIRVTQILPNW